MGFNYYQQIKKFLVPKRSNGANGLAQVRLGNESGGVMLPVIIVAEHIRFLPHISGLFRDL
jgi:hypothetical protein